MKYHCFAIVLAAAGSSSVLAEDCTGVNSSAEQYHTQVNRALEDKDAVWARKKADEFWRNLGTETCETVVRVGLDFINAGLGPRSIILEKKSNHPGKTIFYGTSSSGRDTGPGMSKPPERDKTPERYISP